MTEQNQTGENQEGEINVEDLTQEQLAEIEESEKFILDFKDEDYDDPDKVEELKKHHARAKTTIHQKRHFRDKVGTLTTEIETLKKGPKPAAKKPEGGAPEAGASIDATVALEFRQDHPELSKEVAKEVVAHAKAYNITPEEALAKPFMQAYIKSLNKEEDIDEASPASKNRGGAGSGIEKKDWSNASQAEIEEQRRKMMGY